MICKSRVLRPPHLCKTAAGADKGSRKDKARAVPTVQFFRKVLEPSKTKCAEQKLASLQPDPRLSSTHLTFRKPSCNNTSQRKDENPRCVCLRESSLALRLKKSVCLTQSTLTAPTEVSGSTGNA